jgi:hypothetical protein
LGQRDGVHRIEATIVEPIPFRAIEEVNVHLG